MIASLPMYDRPELSDAHSRLWDAIRANLEGAGIQSPDALLQEAANDEVWTSSNLVLSQTCGYPYRTRLHDKVQLVGTPDYGLPGCPPGYYNSYIIAHKNNSVSNIAAMQQGVLAFNSLDSQSGYIAALHHLRACRFVIGGTIETGSHRSSVQAVAERQADIASVDAVSWRFMEQYDAVCEDLKVIGRTKPTPGLPYITAKGHDAAAVAEAVSSAIDTLPSDIRSKVMIEALVDIPASDYLALNAVMAG